MKTSKSQELYLLLNKYDRTSPLNHQICHESELKYPYFYLIKWNLQYDKLIQSKVALQSPFRTEYYYSVYDAPLSNPIKLNKEQTIDLNQFDIINNFLVNQPSIARMKKSSEEKQDLIDLSFVSYTPPVSETFALILIKQGKISLAIDIYQKLILAKPEKRLYFATRISELTKILTQE
jgi:hypothetical protein